ncbi:MAG: response regulator [Parcubacteria group bacterium]|nr:response regulator [Parcubacteria group bacterium]
MTSEANSNVLIVDDDKFLLDMYSLKFKEAAFRVETADSSEAAYEAVKKGGQDVVLLDILMPSMDGFELLKRIKGEGLGQTTKFIVLSNLGEPSDIEKARELGADGYIVKATATPTEVVEVVRKVLLSENKK